MIRYSKGALSSEIMAFLNSITDEAKYISNPIHLASQARYLIGLKEKNSLVAIGGIRMIFWFFPHCFFIVKSEYQGKGMGYKLTESAIGFAKQSYSLLALTVHKENIRAIRLYRNLGFQTCCPIGDKRWMFLPFNLKGALLGRLVAFIANIYLLIK